MSRLLLMLWLMLFVRLLNLWAWVLVMLILTLYWCRPYFLTWLLGVYCCVVLLLLL